jgi:hypothetical protein
LGLRTPADPGRFRGRLRGEAAKAAEAATLIFWPPRSHPMTDSKLLRERNP